MPDRSVRERLLDAAEQLFAIQGFAGTTTREITDTAGTSTGAIFYHFSSKEGLLEALVEERRPHARLEDIFERHPTSPREALTELADHLRVMTSQRGQILRLLLRGDAPLGRDLLERRFTASIEMTADYLYSSLGRRLTRSEADAIARSFLLSIITSELFLPADDSAGFARLLVDLLLPADA